MVAVALACALLASSCRGPAGRDGLDGRDGLVNSKIIDLQINQNEWSYTDGKDNNYFFATISVPELTWNIYNNGIIKIYREYDTQTDKATQIELPYVRLNETQIDENTWEYFQETVDYEFTAGKITIFYTASDFGYEWKNTAFVPEAMHFRLIMMW